jgi:hypothetical protein
MSSPLTIVLRHDTPAERNTQAAIESLLQAYDFDGLLFTTETAIDEAAFPHSHPVLTLNTVHADNPRRLLAEFVHEQLHWFEEAHAERRDRLIERTFDLYATVPSMPPEGAATETSTRLHLLVCYWEYQALKCLLGTRAAREVIEALARHHYRWVYRMVLHDEARIGRLIEAQDLVPERLRRNHSQAIGLNDRCFPCAARARTRPR